MKKSMGFSLLEAMVAVLIIAILCGNGFAFISDRLRENR